MSVVSETSERSVVPEHTAAHRADTYSERTAVAASSAQDRQFKVVQIALAPRSFTLVARFLLTAVTTFVAFAPALSANFFAVVDGSPTLYLVLLPMWAVMIGYGIDQSTRGRVINDKELDWIAALVIGVVVTGCVYLAIPRLLATATLWHVELVPVMAWVFCGCILNFGVRRAFQGWRILVFVVFCFPGMVSLVSAEFGGTPLVYSLIAAAQNSLAVWLALALRPGRWRLSFLAAVCTVLGAVLLTPFSPVAGVLLPSIVTSLGIAVFAFRGRGTGKPAYLAMPQRSLISVLALGLVAALALAVLPGPAPRVRPASMVTAPSDWLDRLAASDEFEVTEQARFGWGPDLLGPGGSVVRYELDVVGSAERVLFLDVFTAKSAGILGNFRGSIWYATNPPARIADDLFRLDLGVIAGGSQNGAETVISPTDPLWASLGWTWKADSVTEGRVFQRIYLMTSKRADQPYNVPRPKMPTLDGTVVGQVNWLARQQDNGEGGVDSERYLDGLVGTVDSMLAAGGIHE